MASDPVRRARVGLVPASMAEARAWRRARVYRKLRARLMRAEPLCRSCAARGLTAGASELDHIIPLHAPGGLRLFWDRDNLQPLCSRCHRIKSDAELRAPPRPGKDPFDMLADTYALD